ncbi:MAG: hypothetical protein A2X08_17820 [Bacteroidetes bacterium GWA2_32_17]|nr:MAG: hypothetical protein A2X08_17820 [Bacteroidetes bacterium GWA2_32_17]
MNDLQKKFIWLAFAEKKTYPQIEKELNVSRQQLSDWTKEFEKEWRQISAIKNIHVSKKIKNDFNKFYEWYKDKEQSKKCEYCGITEIEIKFLLDNNLLETKRARGRKLELDRKEPNASYDNLENIVFACYWCNNAKTDTFTHKEFLDVGKVFKNIWQNRLAKIK